MFKSKLFVLVILASLITVSAQTVKTQSGKKTMTKTMSFNAEDVAMLMETSSIITEENGKIKIKFAPPKRALSKEYQDIDLKTDDQLLFFNGKKIKNLEKFKELYNQLPIGDEIELGVKRDKEKFFVKFKKCDPSKLKSKMKIQTTTIKD